MYVNVGIAVMDVSGSMKIKSLQYHTTHSVVSNMYSFSITALLQGFYINVFQKRKNPQCCNAHSVLLKGNLIVEITWGRYIYVDHSIEKGCVIPKGCLTCITRNWIEYTGNKNIIQRLDKGNSKKEIFHCPLTKALKESHCSKYTI